jgi:hypothetical protein
VVAGDAEHFVPRVLEPLEKTACFGELFGPSALGKIAADVDEVRVERIHASFDRFDQPLVMSAEMEIGQLDEPGHGQ